MAKSIAPQLAKIRRAAAKLASGGADRSRQDVITAEALNAILDALGSLEQRIAALEKAGC